VTVSRVWLREKHVRLACGGCLTEMEGGLQRLGERTRVWKRDEDGRTRWCIGGNEGVETKRHLEGGMLFNNGSEPPSRKRRKKRG